MCGGFQGKNETQVGVSIFSTQVYPQFDFKTYSTKQDVIDAVHAISYKVSHSCCDVIRLVTSLVQS